MMSGIDTQEGQFSVPCVFDRIIRSISRSGDDLGSYADARGYRDAIRRDLEWLLNSRRKFRREERNLVVMSSRERLKMEQKPSLYDFGEIPTSVLNYGIREFSGAAADPDSPAVRMEIIKEIRETIKKFEPRINYDTLNVEAVEDATKDRLVFNVQAELWVLPEWQELRIEIDLSTGDCFVEKGVA